MHFRLENSTEKVLQTAINLKWFLILLCFANASPFCYNLHSPLHSINHLINNLHICYHQFCHHALIIGKLMWSIIKAYQTYRFFFLPDSTYLIQCFPTRTIFYVPTTLMNKQDTELTNYLHKQVTHPKRLSDQAG